MFLRYSSSPRRSRSPTPFDIDITHLTGSNDTPLDAEDAAIRNTISILRARLELPSGLISNSEGGTSRSTDLSVLHHTIHQRLAVVSPLRRLPAEILCEILVLVDASKDGNRERKHPPWYLAHICRFWRAVALSFPVLWNRIYVEIVDPSAIGLEKKTPLSMLENLYKRSSNLPVQMSFVSWPLLKDVDKEWLAGFFSNSHRWGRLNIRCSGSSFNALGPLKDHVPILSALHLRSLEYNKEPRSLADFFRAAPLLTEVCLTDDNCEVSSPRLISFPWRQLTTYRGVYNLKTQCDILQMGQNLTDCALGFSYEPREPPLAKPILARRLSRLCLASPERFLHYLEAPALEELHLRGALQAATLPDFLTRSACQITRLVWDSAFHVFPGFGESGELPPLNVLCLLPCLQTLVIKPRVDAIPTSNAQSFASGRARREFFNAFMSSELCPALVQLAYQDSGLAENAALADILFRMVERRMRDTRPGLAVFRFSFGPEYQSSSEIVKRLESMGPGDARVVKEVSVLWEKL